MFAGTDLSSESERPGCPTAGCCTTGPVGVTVDPLTGELGGYAWAENLGWISLSCTNTAACGTTDYGVKTGWCQSVATAPRVSVPAIPRFAWSTDRLEVRAPRR